MNNRFYLQEIVEQADLSVQKKRYWAINLTYRWEAFNPYGGCRI